LLRPQPEKENFPGFLKVPTRAENLTEFSAEAAALESGFSDGREGGFQDRHLAGDRAALKKTRDEKIRGFSLARKRKNVEWAHKISFGMIICLLLSAKNQTIMTALIFRIVFN
jgi:hypothetical protein